MKDKNQMVEIWGDVVAIRSLLMAIVISVVFTMGSFALAPDNNTKQLFFGLIGAVIGFVISALLIKPKRIIDIEKNTHDKGEKNGY